MNQFFIVKDSKPVGPYTPEQLKGLGITPERLVWAEGFKDWVPASTVPELAYIFAPASQFAQPQQPMGAQPFAQPQYQDAMPAQPKTWLAESILATLFCCLPLGIVGIVNASKVSSAYSAGDYNGALEASKSAGKWTKISFVIGIGFFVLYSIAIVVASAL